MQFSDYLAQEWIPALGCTEPASIAMACATAAAEIEGNVQSVHLLIDPRMYKNCYAVGIPNSGHKVGIRWAAAIGAHLTDTSLGLSCFKTITPKTLAEAKALIDANAITVDIDTTRGDLFIDCRIEKSGGSGHTVIEIDHTNIALVERDGEVVSKKLAGVKSSKTSLRQRIASMSIDELIVMARGIAAADRERLRDGIVLNLKIAKHGLSLFPKRFVEMATDPMTRAAVHACAGVYARMWGEEFPVMSLAGSGNKGIVVSVPLAMRLDRPNPELIDEALALACLITSATTHHLGTLSAACGCSNAAGIGLAAALVFMEGGGTKEIGLAINNMVGNVTGMICDGAKIGCALKTMTAVDAASRSAALALSGKGIPATDGIVGNTGLSSLENMGRITTRGMASTDDEILAIMKEKIEVDLHG